MWRNACRSLIAPLAPASSNRTGIGRPRRKAEFPLGLMGGRSPLQPSVTRTANVPCRLLPLLSTAVQVTIVVPSGNVDPDGGVQVTFGAASAMSVAVTL